MNSYQNIVGNWCRPCPICGKIIEYGNDKNAKYYSKVANGKKTRCHSCQMKERNILEETKRKISLAKTGKMLSEDHRKKMSDSARKERKHRYSIRENRDILSKSVKEAMHRPDVRKKHLDALRHSRWIKVRSDKGQLEMINCWNKMGFNFEPNYQIHTDDFLCYLDGYDKDRNIVLEYDSKYHHRQKEKDLIRQQKIIGILNPKKFWRYDVVNKQLTEIIGHTQ
jgi:hypothetical protein